MTFLLLAVLLAAPVRVPAGSTTTFRVRPPERVTIAAGSFRMGSSADDLQLARRMCADELRERGALLLELSPRCSSRYDNEAPQEEVFVPTFEVDRTEVTVGAYAACVRAGACPASPQLVLPNGANQLPVEGVTWFEAAAYCQFRGGRLPSEAEWERAARGLGTRIWPWGSTWRDGRANHGRSTPAHTGLTAPADEATDVGDGHRERAPVGSYPRGDSVYGVADLAGNVWEWTADVYARDPPQSATRHDPRGPLQGDERTIRGGSYRSPPSELRVARRVGLPAADRAPGVGFRCAYTPR